MDKSLLPPPRVTNLLLFEKLIWHLELRVQSFIGVRDEWLAIRYPATFAMGVAYEILDLRQGLMARVELVDVNEEREPIVLQNWFGSSPQKDARGGGLHSCELSAVTIPEPGEYRLRLRVNDDFHERRVWFVVDHPGRV